MQGTISGITISDSDVLYKRYPEIAQLSELWIKNNLIANASDLPRLYALILNIKQVLDENIMGWQSWAFIGEIRPPCLRIMLGYIVEGSCCLILSRDLTSATSSVSMSQNQPSLPTRPLIT
jgi:hypothetical protein